MTRLFRIPQPLLVEGGANGEPRAFTWRRRVHRITAVLNHWRVQLDWWDGAEVARDYYQVNTDTGLMADLYCEQNTGQWFLERVYD